MKGFLKLKEMNQSDKQTAKTTSSFGLKSVLFLTKTYKVASARLQLLGTAIGGASFQGLLLIKEFGEMAATVLSGGKKR